MALLVDEKRTRFYYGEDYHFIRVDKGLWRCTSHEVSEIPWTIMKEIEEWD